MKTLLLLLIAAQGHSILFDDFEGDELSSIWRRDRFVPGRVEFQSEVVRSGNKALKITLNKGDLYEPGDAESLPSERTEIGEVKKLEAQEGLTYEYSFSLFIPKDIPIANVRLNIAQWKERCLFDKCDPENALIGIQYVDGSLIVKKHKTKKPEILFKSSDEIRDRWIDYKFIIKFSQESDGLIQGFMNNEKIIDYSGITAYPKESIGYKPSENTFYFKMGLYRDQMEEPMVIYADSYKRVQLP